MKYEGMVMYFWDDEFENDKFESDKFGPVFLVWQVWKWQVWEWQVYFTVKLTCQSQTSHIFKLITPQIQDHFDM